MDLCLSLRYFEDDGNLRFNVEAEKDRWTRTCLVQVQFVFRDGTRITRAFDVPGDIWGGMNAGPLAGRSLDEIETLVISTIGEDDGREPRASSNPREVDT